MFTDDERIAIKGILMGYKFQQIAALNHIPEFDVKKAYWSAYHKLGLNEIKMDPTPVKGTRENLSTNNILNWSNVTKYPIVEEKDYYAEYKKN